jgi:hypothetical protein
MVSPLMAFWVVYMVARRICKKFAKKPAATDIIVFDEAVNRTADEIPGPAPTP